MATQVQLRRGTSVWHSTFTGAQGEVTVNTDDHGLHVHDGATAGGHRQMLTLPDVVTAGSATKVQVDTKGRVIGRADLAVADLPNLPVDKVTGLVATLAGLADQITLVQTTLADLDAEKLGLPASLPIVTAAEGDLVTFGDVSNGDTPARTSVGGLFTNRILTAPELRGYTELVAAAVSVNGAHTMGGITAGNVKRFTLTGAVTLTLPAVSLNNNTGLALSAVLVQDATGGRSVTFAAPAGETIIWDGGGSQPAIATGAGQETTFSFYRIAGSTHWKGVRTHKGG